MSGGGRQATRVGGFTLVELIVALVLLTAGVLGLSAAALLGAPQLGRARLETRLRARAQIELETRLAAGPVQPGVRREVEGRLAIWHEVSGSRARALTVVVAGRWRDRPLADTLVSLERIW
jgi:type II secretory pathway component PulJ